MTNQAAPVFKIANDQNFEAVLRETLKTSAALVKFSGEWCPPCKAMKDHALPKVSFVQNGLPIIEINADDPHSRETAVKHRAFTGLPVLVLYQQQTEDMELQIPSEIRRAGPGSSGDIQKWLAGYLPEQKL